jgi:Rieske 2Fe-2S family protein
MSKALPFGAAELQASIAGSGQMLPGAAYTDPDVLAWENEHFFAAGWMCIGRAEDLANPGDRRAYAIGEEGVLVVRGSDGVLRAFYNTCRHRAHELLPCGGQGSGKFIRCPYHAWVFNTEGELHGVPPAHDGDVPDKSLHSLKPVRLEDWHGYLMVNVSGDAPALPEYFRGLEEIVGPYSLERLRVGDTHTYTLETNWKLIVENYHECFHCPTVHPELCRVSDPDTGDFLVGEGAYIGGGMLLREGVTTMSLDGTSSGLPIPGLPQDQLRDILYVQLFGNLLVSLHPDYVMVHRVVPLAPDRTFVECQWLFPPEAFDKPGFDPSYAVDFWDITNRQDWTACESVQRGVGSRGYAPGPFSSFHEASVRGFLAMAARSYISGNLPASVLDLFGEAKYTPSYGSPTLSANRSG